MSTANPLRSPTALSVTVKGELLMIDMLNRAKGK